MHGIFWQHTFSIGWSICLQSPQTHQNKLFEFGSPLQEYQPVTMPWLIKVHHCNHMPGLPICSTAYIQTTSDFTIIVYVNLSLSILCKMHSSLLADPVSISLLTLCFTKHSKFYQWYTQSLIFTRFLAWPTAAVICAKHFSSFAWATFSLASVVTWKTVTLFKNKFAYNFNLI